MVQFSEPKWKGSPRSWQKDSLACIRNHFRVSSEPVLVSAIMGAGKSILIQEICGSVILKVNEIVVVSTSSELLVRDLYNCIKDRCPSYGVWYGKAKKFGRVIVTCMPSLGSLAKKILAEGKTVALWVCDEAHKTECETVLAASKVLKPSNILGLTATPFRSKMDKTVSLFKKCIYRYGVKEAKKDGVIVPWKINHSVIGGDLDQTCIDLIKAASGPGIVNAFTISDSIEFTNKLISNGIKSAALNSTLSGDDRSSIIDRLKSGDIKCIVHVNMLVEGANFPWLRWLCLRREVGSRVRFIQEIGRLLRAYPGKDVAIFYDPHDLFGQFNLNYKEALGEVESKEEVDDAIRTNPSLVSCRVCDPDPAIAIVWIESLIRGLTVAAECDGMLIERKIIKKVDRCRPINPLQKVAIISGIDKAKEFIPSEWLSCFNALKEKIDCIRHGFASDLITVLQGIYIHKAWPSIHEDGTIETIPTFVGENGQIMIDFAAMEV